LHAYSRCWLHLTWGTLERRPMLQGASAPELSRYLTAYAPTKGIYLKVNYVNADHAHLLIDLPASLSIAEVVQLFKGSSSHWVNESGRVPGKFGWARGYGAFSVSQSAVEEVAAYIANQQEHHRRRTFAEELKAFAEKYGLKWHEDESR